MGEGVAPLESGRKAPSFSLKDRSGASHRLADIEADFVILFFYPKDSTPGCTLEAAEFSKALPKFKRLAAIPIGISGGDAKSKEKFCSKNHLKTLMLSDPDFRVASKYGVYTEKSFMGRNFLGIVRTTFVLDSSRRIVKVFEKVKAAGHAEQVLDYLRSQREVSRSN